MSTLDRLEKVNTRVSRIIALIGLAGFLCLAMATVLDVFMRWIFNAPITGVRDAASAFTSVFIASCFAVCIAERSNITVRLLGGGPCSPWRHGLDAFGNLVTAIVFAAITWQLWLFAEQLAADGEKTWVLRWPLAPWWRVAAILFAICVPVQSIVFLRTVRSALKKRAAQPKSSRVAGIPRQGSQ